MKTPRKTALRERLNFDAGWKFQRGDSPKYPMMTKIAGWKYKHVGKDRPKDAAMAAPDYNDSSWTPYTPPRDAFDRKPGFAWFRVTLPAMDKPGRILHFISVSDAGRVYLNGKELAYHETWNDPFEVELDSAWNTKGKNVLAVLVQNWWNMGFIDEATLEYPPEATAKAGPASAAFDDKSWREVRLPHDHVVEESFDSNIQENCHGYLPKVEAWYRKEFDIPAADKGRQIWIDFDGAFRNTRVWVNGNYAGRHWSGYTGFRFNIGKYLNYGGKNTIAVRTDARGHEGWFYEGGGIYRHVWLNKAGTVHVKPWGVFIKSEPKAGKASLEIETTLVNNGGAAADVAFVHEILDKKGRQVAEIKGASQVKPGAESLSKVKGTVNSPLLWSPETPDLYTATTTLFIAGKAIDRVENTFGIRSIKFDADKGFLLNGKPAFLKGTCNHQDHAGIGAAVPDTIFAYRVKRLKEMGTNAYRCAHNPPAPELLDECDRQGMFVIDENRRLGDSADVLGQVETMILRDRNHPSIVMWSICNEEREQGTELGATRARAMKKVINRLDPTRPITAAMNGDWGRGVTGVIDLQGFNYNIVQYDPFRKKFPKMPMFGSETGSTVSTRGEYVTDTKKGYVSAYDVNTAEWSHTAQEAWAPIVKRRHMFGSFIWTGFDYRGEPTPYAWPCINSHFGIIDTCGFPKDNYYYYQAIWKNEPVLHLFPHWNWKGMEGREIDVWCHTNYDQVELFINGRLRGLKEAQPGGHVFWKVRYEPGELKVKAYKEGVYVTEKTVVTTGDPASIRLTPHTGKLRAGMGDTVQVNAEILDAKGNVVPTASNMIKFSVKGQAEITGVGNGDPSCHEPDFASKRSAFHGMAAVFVRAKETSGNVEVSAEGEGLKSASVVVKVVG